LRKRSKRRGQPQQPAQVFFTLPTIRLINDALCAFEKVLLQKPGDLPNIPFAKEVVFQLKNKLEDMLQMEDWDKRTPFDYNEIHVLYAAVHMYLIELKFTHQDALLAPCIALCQHFSRMVEYAGVKPIDSKKDKA
jgi:hypothetical protein